MNRINQTVHQEISYWLKKNTLLQYGNSNVTSGKQKHIFAHTELN